MLIVGGIVSCILLIVGYFVSGIELLKLQKAILIELVKRIGYTFMTYGGWQQQSQNLCGVWIKLRA
jgi:threonine/homoserine/homoserine lactone efflux protein